MATAQVYENGGGGWRAFTGGDIPNSGVTAGTYGDSTHVGQVAVNAQGQVTSASSVAISASSGVSSLDSITGAVTLVAGSNVTISDNTPGAGQITIAASGGGGGMSELSYTQITSTVNVTSTTEASGTTIIDLGTVTFPGTPVLFDFFSPDVVVETGGGNQLIVSLFEGATQIGRLAVVCNVSALSNQTLPVHASYRFTPSAASHHYTVTAFVQSTANTPSIGAGAGGTGTLVPAFGRFTQI